MRRRAPDWLVGIVLAPCLAACTALFGGPPRYESRPGPHDRLESVLPEEVAEVQRLRTRGALDTARAYVARLASREPDNLPLAFLQQDVELEAGGAAALDELRAVAVSRLEREPDDLVALILAARLAEPERARAWLDRALDTTPDSVWPHYALAHLEASEGRWGLAAERLERALLIDPGHLAARRLHTRLLARGGPRDEAIDELERWLAAARQSPFLRRSDLDEARMDLAHQLLLDGRPDEVVTVLDQLDGSIRGGVRAQQLLAATLQAQGEPAPALAAARRAQAADPTDPLPLVQQALLEEEWLADPASARERWSAVLEVAQGRADLGALLLALRARAALERLGQDGDQAPAVELP